jgi:hypothetical protein
MAVGHFAEQQHRRAQPEAIMKLLRLRKDASPEGFPTIVPLANEDEWDYRRDRAMSMGTRLDLIVLSLWLIAAVLAAVGILGFLLFSLLLH